MGEINSEVEVLTKFRVPNTLSASDMLHGANLAARSYRNALLVTKEDEVRKELETAQKARQQISDAQEKLEKNLSTEKGRELFKTIVNVHAPYGAVQEKLTDLIKGGKHEEAVALLMTDVRPKQLAFMQAVQEMIDTGAAAVKLGVKTVCGFTGSPIWPLLYPFPPVPPWKLP